MTTVSIQGIQGSYSHEAATTLFGPEADLRECSSFEEAVKSVVDRSSTYALLPLENKIIGSIVEPLRLIREYELFVIDRIRIKIDHKLIGTADSTMAEIRSVRSHPEAIKQCQKFFHTNSNIMSICSGDTASSVRDVVIRNDRTQAAIGSARSARIYGAKIIGEEISDDSDNWTAFGLIAKPEGMKDA